MGFGCGTPLMVVNGIVSLLQNKRVRDERTFGMNLWVSVGGISALETDSLRH